MKKSQKQKIRSARARENAKNWYLKRTNWTVTGGPLLVDENPSDDHVKSLLMDWRGMAPMTNMIVTSLSREYNNLQRGRWSYSMEERMDMLISGMARQRSADVASILGLRAGVAETLDEWASEVTAGL